MQTELAERNAALRQQQLVAEVVKPAEAEAEKVRTLAQADAERMTILAEAAASHNRVALDRTLIDQLPQIVKEAAAGLAGANISVLNGADGLGEIAAGLVAQGLTILDSVRSSLGTAASAARLPPPRAPGRGGPGQADGQQRSAVLGPVRPWPRRRRGPDVRRAHQAIRRGPRREHDERGRRLGLRDSRWRWPPGQVTERP